MRNNLLMMCVFWVGILGAIPVTQVRYEPGVVTSRLSMSSPKPLDPLIIPQPPYATSRHQLAVFIPHAHISKRVRAAMPYIFEGGKCSIEEKKGPVPGVIVFLWYDQAGYQCNVKTDQRHGDSLVVFELSSRRALQLVKEYHVDVRYA